MWRFVDLHSYFFYLIFRGVAWTNYLKPFRFLAISAGLAKLPNSMLQPAPPLPPSPKLCQSFCCQRLLPFFFCFPLVCYFSSYASFSSGARPHAFPGGGGLRGTHGGGGGGIAWDATWGTADALNIASTAGNNGSPVHSTMVCGWFTCNMLGIQRSVEICFDQVCQSNEINNAHVRKWMALKAW